ncbi:Cyclic di-GMP phosphodiesterase response regulator RpfG [compost metagenome]
MAVADVYDALISERVYKSAFTHETAVEIIRDGRGSHFDPDMVDAFLVLSEEFRAIAQRFADSAPMLQAQIDRLAADVPTERIELTVRDE